MRVLAIETSGDLAGLALAGEEGVLAALRFRHRMQLSRDLFPHIEQLLAMAGITTREIDGLAVTVGPGSFTGLRISVTAAKSMAYALDIPVAGIGTLEAAAASCPAFPGSLVCAVISASASEVYAGLYRVGGEICPEALISLSELTERLVAYREPVLLVGQPGVHLEALRRALGERLVVGPELHTPGPEVVARLGRMRLLAGQADSTHALAPRYLRPSAAEARRQGAACPNS